MQAVHAAGESSPGSLPEGTHAVVLAVPDEPTLAEIEQHLLAASIPHRAIREPDPPWDGALMAVGLEPTLDRRAIRRVLGRLPLLK